MLSLVDRITDRVRASLEVEMNRKMADNNSSLCADIEGKVTSRISSLEERTIELESWKVDGFGGKYV